MDPASRRFMWKIVDSITKTNKNRCVVLTTHTMEEAEFLSTKMGIMVQGGIFRCFGTSEHIKDKFGNGYEIEVRMQEYDDDFVRKYINDKGLKEGTQAEMVDQLVESKWVRYDVEVMIANDLGREAKNLYEVVRYYLCQQTQYKLISSLLKKFGTVEVLESYGKEYIKLLVPKLNHSAGYIFGLIEDLNLANGIQQFSVSQTQLEMIFNYFAQGGLKVGDSNKTFDAQTSYKIVSKEIEVRRQEEGLYKMPLQ